MKHFSTSELTKPALVKYLHRLDGSVITSRTVALLSPFNADWITYAICSEFDCRPDDVSTIENDEGEWLAVNGVPVATIDEN